MVSKHILLISDQEIQASHQDLLGKNLYLHNVLTKYKNKITEHYKNKLWDRYKKLSNEYEMIFTTPNTGNNISLYNPVSRSFFKMWEMLHDFHDILDMNTSQMNVMFLAEGPGGFAEAFIKYRSNSIDSYHGISLKSSNKNIPDWKYQHSMTICYGEDGTGDLYKKQNLDYLANTLPKMDIITADGGFDFSNDFNSQEELSLRLILCEIYGAIHMQKDGGHFILKIYDIFHQYTIKTICILKTYYEHIYVVKPLSSRPANSEKYLVCTNFLGNTKSLDQLSQLISNYNDTSLKRYFEKIDYNTNVLHNILVHNVYYTLRQIYYIEQTIQYIQEFGKNFYDENIKAKIKQINLKHKQKAIKWCEKYNLEHVT